MKELEARKGLCTIVETNSGVIGGDEQLSGVVGQMLYPSNLPTSRSLSSFILHIYNGTKVLDLLPWQCIIFTQEVLFGYDNASWRSLMKLLDQSCRLMLIGWL